MNVHKLNGERKESPDSYKSLLLLDEISKGEPLSQRDLSKRMNVALGLVNSYIRNLVAKGYLRVSNISKNNCKYLLTPRGFSEKTRLAYDLLQDYTRIYREARENLKQLFKQMGADGVKKVVFAGADEVAEIAYITLQETGIKLTGVVDGEMARKKFFGLDIRPVGEIKKLNYDCVVITTYLRREQMYKEVLSHGIDAKDIRLYFGNLKGRYPR